VVLLTGCASRTTAGGSPAAVTSAPPPPPVATVSVVPDPATIGTFRPPSITIAAGQSVTWMFQDVNPHTVTADDASFSSAQTGLANGQRYSHTFTQPGTYAYHCFIHPQMHGTVTVQ
jgi:plastocyanin